MVVSSGPALRLTAQAGEATAIPGDTLPATGPFSLGATVANLSEPARLVLRGNGAILAEQVVEGEGRCRYTREQVVPGWYRAELRALQGGAMLALASPLFAG
jgi:hypothetical protein